MHVFKRTEYQSAPVKSGRPSSRWVPYEGSAQFGGEKAGLESATGFKFQLCQMPAVYPWAQALVCSSVKWRRHRKGFREQWVRWSMRISEAQGSSSGIQLLFKARFHAVSVLITEWGQSLHSVHVTFFLFFFLKSSKAISTCRNHASEVYFILFFRLIFKLSKLLMQKQIRLVILYVSRFFTLGMKIKPFPGPWQGGDCLGKCHAFKFALWKFLFFL